MNVLTLPWRIVDMENGCYIRTQVDGYGVAVAWICASDYIEIAEHIVALHNAALEKKEDKQS